MLMGTFVGNSSAMSVLLPISIGVYSKRKDFALHRGNYFLFENTQSNSQSKRKVNKYCIYPAIRQGFSLSRMT